MRSHIFFIYFLLINGYTYSQTTVWARATGGPDSGDFGTNIVIDSNGNTYTCGNFRDITNFDPGNTNITETAMPNGDIYIQKLSSSGSLIWVKVFKNQISNEAPFIALDSNNNIYITSQFTGSIDLNPGIETDTHNVLVPYPSAFLVKLNTNGEYIWGKHFELGPTTNSGIETTAIEIDKQNNILLAGEFQKTIDFNMGTPVLISTATGRNNFILKLNNDGDYIWNKIFIANVYGSFRIKDIDTDSQNNIVLAGATYGQVFLNPPSNNYVISDANYPDLAIVKINSNGDFIWGKVAQGTTIGTSNSIEEPNSISIDTNDNIYLSGNFNNQINLEPSNTNFILNSGNNPLGQLTPFFAKMNSAGNIIWAKKMDGGYSYQFYNRKANSISTNNSNKTFVSMNYLGTFNYTINGNSESSSTYYSPTTGMSWGFSLAEIDPENGNYINMKHFINENNNYCFGINAKNNSVYFTGAFSNTLNFGNGVNITTSPSSTTGHSDAFAAQILYSTLGIPSYDNLNNNIKLFPNPVNNKLNINSNNLIIKNITITDLTGKEIEINSYFLNENTNFIDTSKLQTGYYILTIHAFEGTFFKKFIKI